MKNINKFLFCTLAVILIFNSSVSLHSQYRSKSRVEISAAGTYLFGGVLNTTQGHLNFVNNFGFVGDLEYKINDRTAIGLSYTYVPTELRFEGFSSVNSDTALFKMDMHYFFLHYIYQIEGRSTVPFFLAGFGGVIVHPKATGYDDVFRGALDIGGGVKIYASKKVGFKFQARLILPYYPATVGIYSYSSSAGYSNGSGAVIQADISLGLTYKF